jgi:PEP-CTERM motif
MIKGCLISVTALSFLSCALCRADIVVNYGPPNCPPCVISASGQPDLTSPGSATSAQQFTLASTADISSITFWTYEVPGVANVPVDWSITNALSLTVGSGADSDPSRDTPLQVTNLANLGLDLQVSMITIDLTSPLIITNPVSGNYTLNLKLVGDQDSYYWAEGTDDKHYAFQLTGTENAVVPEPSYFLFAAAGLGLLTAFRIRRKR